MANSHQIGKKHEDQVENLLQDWRVRYERKKKYKTNQIVTGQENFLSKQVELLKAELGPDFHVVSVEHHDQFRNLLE
jgi:hypothetical protein